MSSTLFKLCALALVLSVVFASPLERERRSNWFHHIGEKVRGAFSWIFPPTHSKTEPVEKEAEFVLLDVEKTISKGKELVSEGENLLRQAGELETSLDSDGGKKDDDDDQTGNQSKLLVIQALVDAAQLIIKTGGKVIINSENITSAIKDPAVNIADAVDKGVAEVVPALLDLKNTITETGQVLLSSQASDGDIPDGLGDDLIVDLGETYGILDDIGQSFQEVSSNTVTLVQKISKLGKKLRQVFSNAAKAIIKAAGFSGRK